MKICCFPREGSDRFCHELLASACCVFSSPSHDGTSPFLIHLLGASHFAPFTQPRSSWPLAPAWACSSQVIGCFWASDTPGVTGRRQKGQSVSCLPNGLGAASCNPQPEHLAATQPSPRGQTCVPIPTLQVLCSALLGGHKEQLFGVGAWAPFWGHILTWSLQPHLGQSSLCVVSFFLKHPPSLLYLQHSSV